MCYVRIKNIAIEQGFQWFATTSITSPKIEFIAGESPKQFNKAEIYVYVESLDKFMPTAKYISYSEVSVMLDGNSSFYDVSGWRVRGVVLFND